jgi:orotidine-5'-phosphate decarboxylase
MNRKELIAQIKEKKSFLCIGLDTDIKKIPSHLLKEEDPVFEFNKQIIDATKDLCVAYKPNLAFYESNGPNGMISLEKTVRYIPSNIFSIADAKRGDIGNTSEMYARTFFEYYNFDSVTVAPYMGEDSVKPFLNFKDKWVILLALTSNEGAKDFQLIKVIDQMGVSTERMFETVIQTSMNWGDDENMMYVVGATKADLLKRIRQIIPDHFLLVPGIGAQGGSLEEVWKYGANDDIGLLVNASRNIIYAGNGKDFAEKARQEALNIQQQMQRLMENE